MKAILFWCWLSGDAFSRLSRPSWTQALMNVPQKVVEWNNSIHLCIFHRPAQYAYPTRNWRLFALMFSLCTCHLLKWYSKPYPLAQELLVNKISCIISEQPGIYTLGTIISKWIYLHILKYKCNLMVTFHSQCCYPLRAESRYISTSNVCGYIHIY